MHVKRITCRSEGDAIFCVERPAQSMHFLVAAASAIGYARLMTTRLAAFMCLVVLTLGLGGCTKCGWLWDQAPRSCHSDPPR